MNNGFKTAASLAFGLSLVIGSAAFGNADSVDSNSESHRTETTTNAAPPAVVMVQPAPVAVVPAPEVVAAPTVREHSTSHSASSESSPNGNSTSEKSSDSRSTGY